MVSKLLLSIADEFIDSVANFSCRLAKHRGGDTLEVRDLQLHLGKLSFQNASSSPLIFTLQNEITTSESQVSQTEIITPPEYHYHRVPLPLHLPRPLKLVTDVPELRVVEVVGLRVV